VFQVFGVDWFAFFLVWARSIGVILLFPFFSWRGIPVAVRLWISLVIAFLIFSSIQEQVFLGASDSIEAVLLLAKETATGLALGYLVALFFSLFLNAGQLVDLEAGLMLSGVFDPQFGSQVTFIGQFYYLLALVYYLVINGHHHFLQALADSYRVVPLGTGLFPQAFSGGVLKLFADIMVISFQMVAPVVITLLLVDLALGLVAKTVPQVHVFIEGIPLKIAFALLLVGLMLPLVGMGLENLLDKFLNQYGQLLTEW